MCVCFLMPMSSLFALLPLPAFRRLTGSWHTAAEIHLLSVCVLVSLPLVEILPDHILSSPVTCCLVLHLPHKTSKSSISSVCQCVAGLQPFQVTPSLLPVPVPPSLPASALPFPPLLLFYVSPCSNKNLAHLVIGEHYQTPIIQNLLPLTFCVPLFFLLFTDLEKFSFVIPKLVNDSDFECSYFFGYFPFRIEHTAQYIRRAQHLFYR